jgi:molecular chaperone DnaK (HSP70)
MKLPEATVTVEHMVNDNDILLTLTREEFVIICNEELMKLKNIIATCLKEANVNSLAAVELLGNDDNDDDLIVMMILMMMMR